MAKEVKRWSGSGAQSGNQWRRQNFSAAGAQLGHQNLDWGIFKKVCVPSLFEVEAYTVATNGSTHGGESSFL